LEHGIGESREDIVDFRQEKGEEARVTVTEDGEESHELVEVVSWSHCERLRVRRKERENVSKRACDVKELFDLENG
jgi:hypothetical protein